MCHGRLPINVSHTHIKERGMLEENKDGFSSGSGTMIHLTFERGKIRISFYVWKLDVLHRVLDYASGNYFTALTIGQGIGPSCKRHFRRYLIK